MILSLDEAILKLKTEIISQDWSLSHKKIEPLQAAFACLKNRFNTRKNALAILSMADSVLRYAQRRQEPVSPEFVDFLKEAMAHVVNMYEDGKLDPDRDAELYKRVYGKFARLKEKAAAEKGVNPRLAEQETGLFADLESLVELLSSDEAVTEQPQIGQDSGQAASKAAETEPLPVQAAGMIRPITIGHLALGIAEKYIALIRPLSPKKRKKYLKNNQIPLKDLGGWFSSLSGQMQGPLALFKNSRLKKLVLPLLYPQGLGLAELPDEEASLLVVVSNGQWHGVILCRLAQEAAPLLSLVRAKNGDLVGPGRVGEIQEELYLLNIRQLLEREGFLFLPDSRQPVTRHRVCDQDQSCIPNCKRLSGQEGATMQNKRKNTRVPFQVVISLDFPTQSHTACKTADLSLKGVFVLGVTGHKLGEHCLVSLGLAGSTSQLSLKMKGTVVRVKEDGVALHFYEMDLDSFSHLKNILYYNSEDPDTLDEEFVVQFESSPDKER